MKTIKGLETIILNPAEKIRVDSGNPSEPQTLIVSVHSSDAADPSALTLIRDGIRWNETLFYRAGPSGQLKKIWLINGEKNHIPGPAQKKTISTWVRGTTNLYNPSEALRRRAKREVERKLAEVRRIYPSAYCSSQKLSKRNIIPLEEGYDLVVFIASRVIGYQYEAKLNIEISY